MKILDNMYGEFEVDGFLEELIKSKPVQRLKNIHQVGASYLVNPKWNVTRYDHSIGTMLLVRMLGGSLEEQVAALLHDISHTAFSHVVDYALDKKDEDYHEDIFKSIVEASELPNIIKKYGYNYEEILYKQEKWTVLEKSTPKLCADRIDYTLRDLYNYEYISKLSIERFLESLIVIDGEIIINDIAAAEWFVNTYYKEVIDFFMDPLNVYANNKLAEIIRLALKLGVISLEDLLADDNFVYDILRKSNNAEIAELVNKLNSSVNVIVDKEKYDIYQKNKIRVIDPMVILNEKLYIASEKSILVKILNENALRKAEEGTYIRILEQYKCTGQLIDVSKKFVVLLKFYIKYV